MGIILNPSKFGRSSPSPPSSLSSRVRVSGSKARARLASAASSLMGSVKPTFPSSASSMPMPNAASGIISTAIAANKILPQDSRVRAMLNKIPDLPGTWDDKTKDFIAENPIVSAAGFGLVATAAGAGIVYTATRKKKAAKGKTTKRKTTKRKTTKRKSTKRKSSRRKKGIGTAAQYARPGGKSVKYAKNGTPYIIMANGRARFIKGKRR